jgi:hypothetical protein
MIPKLYSFFLIVSTLMPMRVQAGSATLDCATEDQRIVFSTGNGSNTIKIKYFDKKRRKLDIYTAPVKVTDHYDYNAEDTDHTVTVDAIDEAKIISEDYRTMHVLHKDSTECYGRERWSTKYMQRFRLKINKPALSSETSKAIVDKLVDKNVSSEVFRALLEKGALGMNSEDVMVAMFKCRDYGVTSPSGCFAGEGDKVIWEKEK